MNSDLDSTLKSFGLIRSFFKWGLVQIVGGLRKRDVWFNGHLPRNWKR